MSLGSAPTAAIVNCPNQLLSLARRVHSDSRPIEGTLPDADVELVEEPSLRARRKVARPTHYETMSVHVA